MEEGLQAAAGTKLHDQGIAWAFDDIKELDYVWVIHCHEDAGLTAAQGHTILQHFDSHRTSGEAFHRALEDVTEAAETQEIVDLLDGRHGPQGNFCL
eukprot:CAMPEP_0180585164 /NCGR_PEP_ID=MMETSP1037_2-20121125/15969_1 /TAXON_ID=632150 /ORGANISM="Azadinium spinosum, Strain 3D9" /LENGTH=96 /DNA_ID=CAMNT_0022603255 /DNA_START=623 /DNA_END=913 /DNA_ORIENTATION=+